MTRGSYRALAARTADFVGNDQNRWSIAMIAQDDSNLAVMCSEP
jgi:hypothetical protein